MKYVNRIEIEVVEWKDNSKKSKKDAISSLNGWLTIRPNYPDYIESVKNQIKFLEYNKKFQDHVIALRKKHQYSLKLPKLDRHDYSNKNKVLISWQPLTRSTQIDLDGVSLAIKYMQGELPLSFSTYLAYNFFPIEKSPLGISFSRRNDNNSAINISIDRKMGIDEFTHQARILFPHIKKYVNKLEQKQFSQKGDNLIRNLKILKLLSQGLSNDEINTELEKDNDNLEPESLRVTINRILKSLE